MTVLESPSVDQQDPRTVLTGELRMQVGRDHASLKFTESPAEVYVDTVFVPSAGRGQGIGSRLMDRVFWLADAQAKVVRLRARPIGTTGLEPLLRLIRYYERLGFAVVEREAGAAIMVRRPTPPASGGATLP